jgi:hypothetical protein
MNPFPQTADSKDDSGNEKLLSVLLFFLLSVHPFAKYPGKLQILA